MDQPQIRYTKTSDGVSIAYFAIGSGRTLVYMPPMPWTHIELEWKVDDLRLGAEAAARAGRYVRYDGRGFGLSDRNERDFSVDAMVRDLEAVVDAVGLESFALMAHQNMAMPAVTFASRYPERVAALVLPMGYASGEAMVVSGRWNSILELARTDWGLCKEYIAQSVGFDRPEAHRQFKKLIDEAVTRESYIEYWEAIRRWDVNDVLKDVRAPALVLARREFENIPIEAVRELAAGLPDAEFVTLDGPVAALTAPDASAAIAAFLRRIASSGAPEPGPTTTRAGGLRTVLFTDIVGHTEMMQRLGDAKGRDVLREHERITRDLLKQHGGAEVKTMGDGFMASFGSVTAAMDCAIALQRAFAARDGEPLQVRVGLNAGEPIEEDGDLFGATVILASRIAAKAGPGEILIPEPIRHLLAGKSYAYADRGETMLKGFDDAVRLYEVRWSE